MHDGDPQPASAPTDRTALLAAPGWMAALRTLCAAGLVVITLAPLLRAALAPTPPIEGLLPWALGDVVDDRRDRLLYHAGLLVFGALSLVQIVRSRQSAGAPTVAATAGRTLALVAALGASLGLALLDAPATWHAVVSAALCAVGLAIWWSLSRTSSASARSKSDQPATRWRWAELLVPLLLGTWLWLESPSAMAGCLFIEEQFHHYDCFAMSPIVLAESGWRIGLDSPTMYGLGLTPTISALMSPMGDVTYPGLVRLVGVALIVYYTLLYALVRRLGLSIHGAAATTVIALCIRDFHATAYFPSLLERYPQATVARWFFDVFWLHGLVTFARAGRVRWLHSSALVCGVAIWITIDTGLYLAAAHAAYAACLVLHRRIRWTEALLTVCLPLLCAFALAAVQLGPLALVSSELGPNLFEQALLRARGYAVMRAPDSGLAALPVLAIPALYAAAAFTFGRDAKRASSGIWFAIAFYGAATYHYYIGRSIWFTWYRVSIPAVLLVAAITRDVWASRKRGEWAARVPAWVAPAALAIGVAVALVGTPKLRRYPNVWNGSAVLHEALGTEATLVNLAPAEFLARSPQEAALEESARAINGYVGTGAPAAVISDSDTLLYAASGCRPFSPRLPLLHMTQTQAQLDDLISRLGETSLKYVFVDSQRPLFAWSKGVLPRVRAWVGEHCELVETRGRLEVWRKRE